MFTKFIKNNEKFFLFILTVSFFATFSVLLYVGHSKAQTFPPPPINENEVEDLNLFQGSATGGRSNVLLGIDFSGSMGNNKAGAQFGNWDGTNIIDSCDNLQRIKDESAAGANKPPQDFAIAHCAANASGITTELVDKDGFVIHSSYSTTTVVTDSTITISTIHPDATIMRTTDGIVESFNNGIAYEGVFRGCGARACTRSKFGTCEDPRDFERFLTCIDIAYSDVLCPTCPATPDDTIVLSVFNTALTVNCAGTATDSTNVASLKSDLINQCDPTADGVTGFDDNDSDGISGYRERISATAAMDNYANYLYAEAQEAAGLVADANDLKTCGGAKCITLNDATVDNTDDFEPDTGPSAVEDHSCRNGTELGSGGGGGGAGGGGSTVNQYDRFAACMAAASQKQPTVRSCSTGGSDAPFCSPAQYGSTRADAMMAVLFQILDRDSSLKTTDCNDTDRLFNGETPISCFNYMNTPYRELGTLPDVTGGGQLPVVGGGKQIESFLTTEDAVLAGFRINGFRFFDIGITGGANTCTTQSSYDTDQGGFAGGSELKFQNTYGELGDIQPTGRTGLAHAIGFDDGDGSGTTISDDALGIYRVEIQTDPGGSECRGNFAIFITDGEDNCSGDCSANPAFGLDDMACDNSIPPETGNSNRRSVLQAASYLRTHFSRFGTNDNASDPDGIEIITFYIGWGLKDNPQGVRNLNAAALLGGTHSSGLLRHMGPQGFVVGNVDLDGSVGVSALLSQADIAEINSNFPWVLEMAEMEVPTGDFASDPAAVTLQDCDVANISESGSCTWDGTSVFDNNFFDGTVGTSVPTVLTKTEIGESFAFFVDNPGELVSVLEIAFDFIRGFSSVGQAPSVPPSVTAIGLRDRVLLPSFAPIIGEPIWQGRLALYGFLDDPDIPGGKIIVRKPSSDSEFIKTVDGVDVLDGDAINSAKIFNDSGSLNSNAEGFFWDAGKLLAERDIVNSARNLITVDSTIFGTQIIDTAFFFDAIVYTTGLVAFDKNLDPEVFGISDQDVDPLGTGSIISICTDVCPDGVGEICDSSVSPLSDACKTCVKEDCLRDKIVDFMSGNTGLLPIADGLGEPTLDSCSANINDNTESGVIGCNCPDIDFTNTNIVDPLVDPGIIASLASCERRLGDINNSQARIVQAPSLLFFDTGFPNFAQIFRDRSAVIYAGANDGFLHAFHAGNFIDVINDDTLSDDDKKSPFTGLVEELPFVDEGSGNELFAYAPPTFLLDSLAPDGTNPLDRIFTGVDADFDPTSPIELQDFTVIDSGLEPLPDFRFGDFKTIVEKNLGFGYLGSNLITDTRNFQRSFFDGTPFIVDVFLDGNKDQTNGIPDTDCASPVDSQNDPDGLIDVCGKEWHTVLVSGFRNGGGGLTALDVTNIKCTDDDCSSTEKRFSGGPSYPQHLWTIFERQMGNTWSQPKAGRIRVNFNDKIGVDRWVLFVGGGMEPYFTNPLGNDDNPNTPVDESANTLLNYEEDVYKGSAFYVIDIASGEIIFKFDKNDDSNFVCDVPADPNVIDINADGYIDLVYLPDKCGRVWRMDVSEPINANADTSDAGIGNTTPDFDTSAWSGSPVFCANDPDAVDGGGSPVNTCLDSVSGSLKNPESTDTLFPMFFATASVIDNLGRRHVIVTSGDRQWPSNDSTQVGHAQSPFGYLYNFIDEYVPSFFRGSSTSTTNTFKTVFDIDGSVANGDTLTITASGQNFIITPEHDNQDGEFLVKFANGCDTSIDGCTKGGEKGVGTPVVINSVLLFTTFTPNISSGSGCAAPVGVGRVFGINFVTGLASLFRVPGAEALIGSNTDIAGIEGGAGMPTPPQITYSSTGTVTMSLAFSGSAGAGGAQFLIWELPRLPSSTQTLYWEEVI